jgi:hypothetical protein
LLKISYLVKDVCVCNVLEPPVQSPTCDFQKTKACVFDYVQTIFLEYTKTCGPDYIALCR